MVGKKSNDAYSLRPQNMKSTAMIKWCLLQVNVACGEDGAVKGLGQGKGYVHQVIFVAARGADLSNVEFGVAIE
jgi:hypothetical protein